MIPRRVRRASVIGAVLVIGVSTVTGCSNPEDGPASIGATDSDFTVCVPADVGEPFIVGDTIAVPISNEIKVTRIQFDSASGTDVDDEFTFTTEDGHSYSLFPLSELQAAVPESWSGRQELPTEGTVNLSVVDDAEIKRAQATIGAVAERTGESAGILGPMRVTYEVDGKAYETRNAMTYYLNNGPCIAEDGNWEDTDYGRAINKE
jgi:hypothetical protein